MEESEKRKERLMAMRMEAERTSANDDSQNFGLPSRPLSNPLIAREVTLPSPTQYPSPRFDFYTDPMAAFSARKRPNNNTPPVISQGFHGIPPRPNFPGMASPPAYQNTRINFPNHGIFPPPGVPYDQSLPHGRLAEVAFRSGNIASAWATSGGSFNYGKSPHNATEGNYANSGLRKSNSTYAEHGQVRGGMYIRGSGSGSSHYPDSGRGRGRIPAYGRRGTDSRDKSSVEINPNLYYKRGMLEDPWKCLTPVIWKGQTSDKSWLPKSIGADKQQRMAPETSLKKPNVASETPLQSISQKNLAEYLASSFAETSDEPDI